MSTQFPSWPRKISDIDYCNWQSSSFNRRTKMYDPRVSFGTLLPELVLIPKHILDSGVPDEPVLLVGVGRPLCC